MIRARHLNHDLLEEMMDLQHATPSRPRKRDTRKKKPTSKPKPKKTH